MPYIEGRVVHDADAHIMEEPTWLVDHADPDVREKLRPNVELGLAPGEAESIAKALAKHQDPEFRARDADEIMQRKNFIATGGTIAADRPLALDLLGVASQLVFNTFNNRAPAAPRAQRRSRPRLRRRPRPQPRDDRVLLG
jgi:uncharacterized protein